MKKTLTLLISLALLVSLIGCKKKAVATEVPTEKEVKAQESAAEVTEEESAIKGVIDLVGKTIGVQAGTTGEIYAQESIEGAQVKSFKTGIDAALALNNGAIDAIILDELPSIEIVKNNPSLTIINDNFSSEEYAVAVKKGNEELLTSINNTLNRIKEDGTYNTLTSAFMNAAGEITIPSVEEIETEDKVIMGTNAAFPPFEYTEGDKVLGFDASLAAIIAQDLGKKLEIQDMNFDALIAALQSGAVDMVLAGMTATDERRENVDFSEPYYTSNQVIIVKK